MQIVNILMKSSDEYSFMAGVALQSLIENASKSIVYNIYVMSCNLREENWNKLKDMCSMSTKDISITLIDANICDRYLRDSGGIEFRGSYAPYYTLLVDFALESYGLNLDRILVIDADSIILSDLADFVDMNLNGKTIGMTWQEKMYVEYIPRNYKYHRASLVLIDLEKWKQNKCRERCLSFLKWANKSGYKFYQEEMVLNFVLQDEIQTIPLHYNIYSATLNMSYRQRWKYHKTESLTEEELKIAINNPQIIHFGRSFMYRPCELGSIDGGSQLWWKYCDDSPWRGMKHQNPLPIGRMELLFRKIYMILPLTIANEMYLKSRRLLNYLHKKSDLEKNYKEWLKHSSDKNV